MKTKYAEVVFNIPVNKTFTYHIPEDLSESVKTGSVVVAPFGKRRLSGVVVGFSGKSSHSVTKSLIKAVEHIPPLPEELINFCTWISEYYICSLGEAVFSAIPSRIANESRIVYSLNDDYMADISDRNEKLISVLKTRKKGLTLRGLEKLTGDKNMRQLIGKLVSQGILKVSYTYSSGLKMKFEKNVEIDIDLSKDIDDFIERNKIKSEAQKNILAYLSNNPLRQISLKELLKQTGATTYSVNSLASKCILKIINKRVTREPEYAFNNETVHKKLNSYQSNALGIISEYIDRKIFQTILLFGVTGSGKTQVYIEAVRETLSAGRNAIILVPEISLTPQLIGRFKSNFGDITGVIHSKLSEGERFDVYQKIFCGEIRIIVGARSAVFAPLKNLGLIAVDEEHDVSYKQSEKNPKYNARDSAIMRARINNAVALLGSATPSLESYFNAVKGKYKLIELPERVFITRQPRIEIVNMLDEYKSSSKFIKWETPENRILSSRLIKYISEALGRKENVILLQNRRGYSAYMQCMNCGEVVKCRSCDITMIYHKTDGHLRCHYCGNTEKLHDTCRNCGSTDLRLRGAGTEKVEEELMRLFPQAKVKRMDSDTVSGKNSHARILKSFADGEYDILVGTQMISKGLDFPNVSLAGVISADIGLFNPDFRASEKTFQLLLQISGRAGRTNDYGKVVIQTMYPEHFIFPYVLNHDYISFFKKEILHRREFDYPPFSRIGLVEVSSAVAEKAYKLISRIYEYAVRISEGQTKEYILKPVPALLYKLKNRYRYHMLIKIPRNSAFKLSDIADAVKNFTERKNQTDVRVSIDIDPVYF